MCLIAYCILFAENVCVIFSQCIDFMQKLARNANVSDELNIWDCKAMHCNDGSRWDCMYLMNSYMSLDAL